ncbi:DNA methyltransferase [Desulfococcaceae bacterium HSG9]|nr:DNA methyltransferase [Desulfococcaceae bacterium HSG9]
MNYLYYGDNLQILREYIQDESIDLIYLDPPFNSNRNYNVLFKNENGTDSEAQITAFKDTWHWDQTAENTYQELVTDAPEQISRMTGALREFIGANQMMAYLVMMTARLIELHRVLKDTGSLYLHCDPTASHYLKIILDTIFDAVQFRNEIIWKRTTAHSDTKQGNVLHMGRVHDIILYYTKTNEAVRNELYQAYNEKYVNKFYKHIDSNGRRYTLDNIAGPGGASKGNPQYEFLGVIRYWRYSKKNMDKLYKQGRIIQTKAGNVPRYKRYLDEMPGIPLQDTWNDIHAIQSQSNERLGYPTQKPLALLERIIKASSNQGDIILDPFCGCGTAIHAAEKLKRRWIGIDITHLSTSLLKYRLKDAFDLSEKKDYKVIGEPQDIESARQLALESRYQFQWWALSLIQAKPLGGKKGSKKGKKGSDGGIDGVIAFIDDRSKKPKRVLVQVKSGKVSVRDIRDLIGTVEREKAAIGVFITLESSTKPMIKESVLAGVYHSVRWHKKFPKIQILTIEQLLNDEIVNMPPIRATFKKAKKEGKGMKQINLLT